MPSIKDAYDRVGLIAIGLIAAVVAMVLVVAKNQSQSEAELPKEKPNPAAFSEDEAVATLKADREALAARKTWNTGEASPFVSRVYLLKDDKLVDILESGTDLFPGISNAWILEQDLDYLDAKLPVADPDVDGFTNFEEFTAKTNPRDAASKPAEWTKLRLTGLKVEQLQLIFTGRDPKGRALINSVAAESERLTGKAFGPTAAYPVDSGKESILKVKKFKPGPGNTLLAYEFEEEETPFKLSGFRMEKRENPSIVGLDGKPTVEEIDFAILESTSDSGTKVELEAGKPQTSPYSLASILDTRPGGAALQIRVGETISLGDSLRYKLVDVSEEAAKIEDLVTGHQHTVPKADPAPVPETTPEEVQQQ